MKLFTLPLTLLLLCAAARSQTDAGVTLLPHRLAYEGKLEKKVDRFTGETSYMLKGGKVYGGDGLSGIFFLAYTKAGEKEKETSLYMFTLGISSKVDVRANDPTLYAIVDSDKKNYGRMILAAADELQGYHVITYTVPISYVELSKLSTAKKVEMRFDGVEFELSEGNRNALMDFIAYSQGR